MPGSQVRADQAYARCLTRSQAVGVTVAVSNYLRHRFHQDEIILVGDSWASVFGVLAVQQHPDLYRALAWAGQTLDLRATDRIYECRVRQLLPS